MQIGLSVTKLNTFLDVDFVGCWIGEYFEMELMWRRRDIMKLFR